MRRRDFIQGTAISAAAWPLATRAQQPVTPVIGFLSSGTADGFAGQVAAIKQGLMETGYIAGKNVEIEYRFANGEYDRLATLATDLVRHRVAVIVTAGGVMAAQAAKTATSSIPIVFGVGADPVKAGLVPSLNRPEGNVTGVLSFSGELAAKRIGLLRDLLPQVAAFCILINPNDPSSVAQMSDAKATANGIGLRTRVLNASNSQEIDAAFASMAHERPDALIIFNDPAFSSRRDQIVAMINRLAIPTIYPFRHFVAAGGLMSYGTGIPEEYRQAGVYAGRILKGVKPADLPVVQPTKFELVINLKTAKTLGLTIPPRILAIADEVIE
jgi:putative tryptophan/tyrosine transport system substrate-binding protein